MTPSKKHSDVGAEGAACRRWSPWFLVAVGHVAMPRSAGVQVLVELGDQVVAARVRRWCGRHVGHLQTRGVDSIGGGLGQFEVLRSMDGRLSVKGAILWREYIHGRGDWSANACINRPADRVHAGGGHRAEPP